jgi:hypothetical protein
MSVREHTERLAIIVLIATFFSLLIYFGEHYGGCK